MSGRKVELEEAIVPSLELESSSSQKTLPVMPTPTREEANDDDHETLDQIITGPVGRTEHILHQGGTAILSWKSCY